MGISSTAIRRIAIAIFVVAVTNPGLPAKAGSLADDWSFLLHPAPRLDDLAPGHFNAIFAAADRVYRRNHEHYCQGWIDTLIKLYVDTWPDAAFYATLPVWRQRWIDAFALTTYKKVISCAISDPAVEFWYAYTQDMKPAGAKLPFYCGRFTGRQLPREAEDTLRLLIKLAFEDDILGAAIALYASPRRNAVVLNADVTYYLLQRFSYLLSIGISNPLMQSMAREFAIDFGGPNKVLTRQRRAEIVAAARRGDAEAILSTTGPVILTGNT